MIENEDLKREVEIYQKTGKWTTLMHQMTHQMLEGICRKYKFSGEDNEDFYQSGYLLMMGVAKIAQTDKNLFNYFLTCIINMGKTSYVKCKKYSQFKQDLWKDGKNV